MNDQIQTKLHTSKVVDNSHHRLLSEYNDDINQYNIFHNNEYALKGHMDDVLFAGKAEDDTSAFDSADITGDFDFVITDEWYDTLGQQQWIVTTEIADDEYSNVWNVNSEWDEMSEFYTESNKIIQRKCMHVWGQRLCFCQLMGWIDSQAYKCRPKKNALSHEKKSKLLPKRKPGNHFIHKKHLQNHGKKVKAKKNKKIKAKKNKKIKAKKNKKIKAKKAVHHHLSVPNHLPYKYEFHDLPQKRPAWLPTWIWKELEFRNHLHDKEHKNHKQLKKYMKKFVKAKKEKGKDSLLLSKNHVKSKPAAHLLNENEYFYNYDDFNEDKNVKDVNLYADHYDENGELIDDSLIGEQDSWYDFDDKNEWIVTSLSTNDLNDLWTEDATWRTTEQIQTHEGKEIIRKCRTMWGHKLCLCQFLGWIDKKKYHCYPREQETIPAHEHKLTIDTKIEVEHSHNPPHIPIHWHLETVHVPKYHLQPPLDSHHTHESQKMKNKYYMVVKGHPNKELPETKPDYLPDRMWRQLKQRAHYISDATPYPAKNNIYGDEYQDYDYLDEHDRNTDEYYFEEYDIAKGVKMDEIYFDGWYDKLSHSEWVVVANDEHGLINNDKTDDEWNNNQLWSTINTVMKTNEGHKLQRKCMVVFGSEMCFCEFMDWIEHGHIRHKCHAKSKDLKNKVSALKILIKKKKMENIPLPSKKPKWLPEHYWQWLYHLQRRNTKLNKKLLKMEKKMQKKNKAVKEGHKKSNAMQDSNMNEYNAEFDLTSDDSDMYLVINDYDTEKMKYYQNMNVDETVFADNAQWTTMDEIEMDEGQVVKKCRKALGINWCYCKSKDFIIPWPCFGIPHQKQKQSDKQKSKEPKKSVKKIEHKNAKIPIFHHKPGKSYHQPRKIVIVHEIEEMPRDEFDPLFKYYVRNEVRHHLKSMLKRKVFDDQSNGHVFEDFLHWYKNHEQSSSDENIHPSHNLFASSHVNDDDNEYMNKKAFKNSGINYFDDRHTYYDVDQFTDERLKNGMEDRNWDYYGKGRTPSNAFGSRIQGGGGSGGQSLNAGIQFEKAGEMGSNVGNDRFAKTEYSYALVDENVENMNQIIEEESDDESDDIQSHAFDEYFNDDFESEDDKSRINDWLEERKSMSNYNIDLADNEWILQICIVLICNGLCGCFICYAYNVHKNKQKSKYYDQNADIH